MLSKKRFYIEILQSIISMEGAISTPGTESWLTKKCLQLMKANVKDPVLRIGKGIQLINPDLLTLGRHVGIGKSSLIVCHAPVDIGDLFMGAAGLYINSGTHDINTLDPLTSPIKIGKRVWCGMRVTICSGVSIGDDVVLGAGSVVTSSIPSGYLAVGVPAKPIKKLEREEVEKLWCYRREAWVKLKEWDTSD